MSSRSKITTAIREAYASGRTVRLQRKFAEERHEGFVHAVGPKWVVLEPVTDRLDFDGYACLRIEDIATVGKSYPEAFLAAIFRARRIRPRPVEVDASSIMRLLESIQRRAAIVAIERELVRPGVFVVGRVSRYTRSSFEMVTVGLSGHIDDVMTSALKDVTKISFGTGYVEGLNLVAKLGGRRGRRASSGLDG